MRVIAGSAKGVRLVAPKGSAIRPTLDRVREAVFSILLPQLAEARFLDLFAGTGANGIEALSRGVEHTTFVDLDRSALATIEKNLDSTHLRSKADLVRLRLPQNVESLIGPFDIAYADPPYAFRDHERLLQELEEQEVVTQDGLVLLEHDRRVTVTPSVGRFLRIRQCSYGGTTISFYA